MAVSNEVSSAPVATGGASVSAGPKGFRQKVSQMIAGLQAVIPDGSSVAVGGQAVAKADLVSGMSQILPFYQAADAAVAATKQARSKLSGQLQGSYSEYLALKDALVASFGRGSPQLAQFGISSSKQRALNPTQKVARAAKARKTRALRHTMGRVQKKAVQYTGTLEVAVNETAPQTVPADGTTPAAQPVGTAVASAPAETPVPAGHSQ
jgi:hypothetical protein